jgi:hypothetical protein
VFEENMQCEIQSIDEELVEFRESNPPYRLSI